MPLARQMTGLPLQVLRNILHEYGEQQAEDVVGYVLKAHPEWMGSDGSLVVPGAARAAFGTAYLRAIEEVLQHGRPR